MSRTGRNYPNIEHTDTLTHVQKYDSSRRTSTSPTWSPTHPPTKHKLQAYRDKWTSILKRWQKLLTKYEILGCLTSLGLLMFGDIGGG